MQKGDDFDKSGLSRSLISSVLRVEEYTLLELKLELLEKTSWSCGDGFASIQMFRDIIVQWESSEGTASATPGAESGPPATV